MLGIYRSDIDFADPDGGAIGYGNPGAPNTSNKTIAEITGTMSYFVVRTENRGSAQLGFQTSWLRRKPWSAGTGPRSADAFLLFAQVRYNLP